MLAGTASMLVGCASGSESGAGSVAAGKDDALKVDSDGKLGGTDSDVSEYYEPVDARCPARRSEVKLKEFYII